MKPIKFLPLVLWLLITGTLLCLPGNDLPNVSFFKRIPFFDKLVHIGLFGMLCLLAAIPLRNSGLSKAKRKRGLFIILIGAIVYGVLMEFVQKYWTSDRAFELADICADSAGCLLAFGLLVRSILKPA